MDDTQNRRVFVGNLSYSVRWPQLKDFMKQAGEVVRADILAQGNGLSRGCGIVEYSTAEEAQRAIEELHNQSLLGRVVYVREDREPLGVGSHLSLSRGGIPNAVFVENLAFTVSWADLKDYFRQAGTVLRADVHTYQGRSKGRGTVVFDSPEAAQLAIATLNNTSLHGRPIRVRDDLPADRRPKPSGQDDELFKTATANGEASDTLFITNLPSSITEESLTALVAPVATVKRVAIQLLPNGSSAGSAVVQTGSVQEAYELIEKLNNKIHEGRNLVISFARFSTA